MTKSASEKMKVKNTANKTGCATRRFVGSDIDMVSNCAAGWVERSDIHQWRYPNE
jgi:hypothetical protein